MFSRCVQSFIILVQTVMKIHCALGGILPSKNGNKWHFPGNFPTFTLIYIHNFAMCVYTIMKLPTNVLWYVVRLLISFVRQCNNCVCSDTYTLANFRSQMNNSGVFSYQIPCLYGHHCYQNYIYGHVYTRGSAGICILYIYIYIIMYNYIHI